MKVGATYHPEIFHPSEWEQDLTVGAGIGLSVIRCGELTWAQFDPETQSIDPGWIPMFLDVIDSLGFEAIWSTPFTGPPPFAFEQWPDLAGDQNGKPGAFCPSHPGYRDLCALFASKMQQIAGNSLSVIGWDVENGFGSGLCTCPRCITRFYAWLEQRYETIDRLNEAWQTRAVGQVYRRWSQILLPGAPIGEWPSPLQLAFHRFRATLAQEHYAAQRDALKSAGASTVVTCVPSSASRQALDRWSWRDTQDAYGALHPFDATVDTEFELSVARGSMVGAKPLWVLERSSLHRRGQNPGADDLTAVSNHLRFCAEAGAQYVLYRPLRQFPAGPEKEHRAIIGHDGRPTRAADSIGAAIRAARTIEPAFAEIDALMLFSIEQKWATETRAHGGIPFDYHGHVQADWFRGLVDVYGPIRIGGASDISGLEEVIVAPFLQLREAALFETLSQAVNSGCTLIITADFGRFDADNNVLPEPLLNILTLWGGQAPDMELVWLPQGAALKGRLNGLDISGGDFVAEMRGSAPKNARFEEIGVLENAKFSGCAALRTRVGQGQIFVAMSALDRAGVAALVRLGRARL